MEITEIRIRLMDKPNEKLRAFCTITCDNEFVIRDVKIIDGAKGPFIAMPSRKMMDHCRRCSCKNHLRARFCNDCGARLDPKRADRIKGGKTRLHTDIAHPINSTCREKIQSKIIAAFEEELKHSSEPGYVPREIDTDEYSESSQTYSQRKAESDRTSSERTSIGENESGSNSEKYFEAEY